MLKFNTYKIELKTFDEQRQQPLSGISFDIMLIKLIERGDEKCAEMMSSRIN